MPFGPSVRVEPTKSASAYPFTVELGECTKHEANDLFPLDVEDASFRFLFPSRRRLLSGTAGQFMRRIVAHEDTVAWAIWRHTQVAELVGYTSLTLDSSLHRTPGFTIVLAPVARGQGIGSIVAATVAKLAFQPNLLHDANRSFSRHIPRLGTVIHADNHTSQRMCETAGYRYVGCREPEIEGELFPLCHYELQATKVVGPPVANLLQAGSVGVSSAFK
jgi:RimJ/RimL family protein N-acetyltransferase